VTALPGNSFQYGVMYVRDAHGAVAEPSV